MLSEFRRGTFVFIAHFIPKGNAKCITEYTVKSTRNK